jgi:hypothetical protein
MDHDIPIPPGWMTTWTDRTNPSLTYLTFTLFLTLSLTSIALGLRALFYLNQTHKKLTSDPSSRAEISASHSKRLHNFTRTQFYISTIFAFSAITFWILDGVVACAAIYQATPQEAGGQYPDIWAATKQEIQDSVLLFLGVIVGLCTLLIVPALLQLLLASQVFCKSRRVDSTARLESYISEVRIITTHAGQWWAMIAYVVMAFSPTYENMVMRVCVAVASFGSAYMWLQLSFDVNFKAEEVGGIKVGELLGIGAVGTWWRTKTESVREKGVSGLPRYEAVAQTEPSLDEKAGA